jgi:hypothetical protein
MQRTSWGQDNPVSKCVILSVLAHGVLLAYAYRWNLVTEVPAVTVPEVVPIRVAAETPPAESSINEPPAERPIWEQLPAAELSPAATWSSAEVAAAPAETEWAVERWSESAGRGSTSSTSPPELPSSELADFLHAPQEATSSQWLEPLLQPTTPITQPISTAGIADLTTARDLPTPAEATRPPASPVANEDAAGDQAIPPNDADRQANEPAAQLLAETLEQLDLARPLPKEDQVIDRWEAGDSAQPRPQPEAAPPGEMAQELPQRLEQLQSSVDPRAAADLPPVSARLTPAAPAAPWSPADRMSAQAARAAQVARRATQFRAADQQPLPEIYRSRLQRDLAEIQVRGGSHDTEQAVAQGLAFLASIQKPDGSWNPRETGGGREQQVMGHNRQGAGAQADTGISALALLAFLADGNTHLSGPYQETVRRGLEFLLQRQQRGGSLAGSAQYYAQMYCHSMALLALGEAHALTGDDRLRAAVEAGVAYSVDAQNRAGGGWRYQPQEAGDMSQFGWQVMALGSAGLSGVGIDDGARRLMLQFLQRHSRGTHGGLAVYRVGEGTTPTMTAEALFCRYLLGQRPTRSQVEEACGEILGLAAGRTGQEPGFQLKIQDASQLPGKQVDNLYFWYYASLALRQAASDPDQTDSLLVHQSWDLWNRHLSTRLLALQRTDGAWAGSWDPETCLWGGYGGRVYTTSLAVLCLQVYYRYDLPGDDPSRTAVVPWSPTPIGPTPPPSGGPAAGSIRDWR